MLYELDYRRKNTKSKIIDILSKNWPLTTKKIYNALKRQYNITVTYQAIHLSLKEFLEEGIIVREGREYMLSPSWIEKTADSFNSLVESYTINNKITTAKEFQELNFKFPNQAWLFLLSKANSNFFGKSDICYVQVSRIFASPIPQDQINQIKAFTSKTKTILLCRRSGVIEKLAANYLRKLGIEVHLNIPCAYPNNVILMGNSVINIYVLYPNTEGKKFDNFYYSTTDILKKDIFATFSAFLTNNIRVKLTINRSQDVYNNVLALTKKLLD